MDWKADIIFVIILCVGLSVISGIFFSHYASPQINYNLQLNGGNYTIDYGPNAAKFIDSMQPIKSKTDIKDLYMLDPNLQNESPNIVVNTECYREVACPCAINTTTPCMLMCFEWSEVCQ